MRKIVFLKGERTGFMFAYIKNMLNQYRAKRLLSYCIKIETAFTLFQPITYEQGKNAKRVHALSKHEVYADIVSRYRDCLEQIEKHNQKIQSLSFAYNSLIEYYPVAYMLDHILEWEKAKIEEIYSVISDVYAYTVPASFSQQKQYEDYRAGIEEIRLHYDTIVAQKKLIASIFTEIDGLPDQYIDESNIFALLHTAYQNIEIYKAYERKFYPVPVIDAATLEQHNEKFIARHLGDSIFDDVNGKSLDTEQRRAVLCNANANLTIAGAGSGKTLTICGKVKYLLHSSLAKEDEILLLSYSKASANDLEQKVNSVAKGLTVETFHALGLKILTAVSKKKQTVEEQFKAHITQFFEEKVLHDPDLTNEVFQYIALYFYVAPTSKKKRKNNGEIFKELKTLDYKTLKDRLQSLSKDKGRRETLKSEFVKSNEELVIANFLFINGVRYEYEKPYAIKTATLEKRQYTPDFYLPDYDIYIEHYGVNREGNAPQYDQAASDEYVRSIEWKREIHRKHQTTCIETYSYEFSEGRIFDALKTRLSEKGVRFHPLSQEKVYNALHSIYAGRDFHSFLNLIMTFISLYKSQMKDDSGFDRLKADLRTSDYEAHRACLFLDICQKIYNFYMQKLRGEDKIDFDDMILQAIDALDLTSNFKYKYIIVDEFQDISQSRTKFLQKLIQHGNAKLFAVGDDWQAIYRFAGCDINVFLEFEKIFPGAKLNYITSTHRNSAELQSIVEPFITANPSQYKKHIRSAQHQDFPVRIVYHNANKSMAFALALADIATINAKANVLVLGRNKHDADMLSCEDIHVYQYKTIKHRAYPELNLTYSTVHGSKGLESDFVVLISGEDAPNGFPNKTEDDHVLNLLLGKKNNFEYAEERRLFYVALTRTRSIVYLLSDKGKPSEFIQEIERKCYILNAEDQTSRQDSPVYLCPWCKSGHLVQRKAEANGHLFYGCSNHPYCKYTNDDIQAVQQNHRCRECGDFLVLRKGKYGTFWGCHNYPRCTYTQQTAEMPTQRPIGF